MPDPSPSTQAHSDRAHARWSPSSAHRWLRCPASTDPNGQEARTDSAASAFGTHVHELAERHLRAAMFGSQNVVDAPTTDMAPEEAVHVQNYVQYAQSIISGIREILGDEEAARASVQIEQRLNTRIRDCWGTCDLIVIWRDEAWIVDLKTGRTLVDAEENEQLLTYAVGVATNFPEVRKFTLVICQATDADRPVKAWRCDHERVLRHRAAIREAIARPERAQIGDHCGMCNRRSACTLHYNTTTDVFNVASDRGRTPPMTDAERASVIRRLTPAQRAWLLGNRSCIEKFLAAVAADCMRDPPPGWKLVRGNSRVQWRSDLDVRASCDALGVEPRVQMPTITDVRRAINNVDIDYAARRRAVLESLTVVPQGRPTLAPESDARPAIDPGEAFALIEEDAGED